MAQVVPGSESRMAQLQNSSSSTAYWLTRPLVFCDSKPDVLRKQILGLCLVRTRQRDLYHKRREASGYQAIIKACTRTLKKTGRHGEMVSKKKSAKIIPSLRLWIEWPGEKSGDLTGSTTVSIQGIYKWSVFVVKFGNASISTSIS